jgi:polyisoprenoid-binding protein YceI
MSASGSCEPGRLNYSGTGNPGKVGMPQLQTAAGTIRVPAGTWRVDPAHSSVAFKIRHMMIATVRGQFSEFSGTLEAAADDPADSRARGSVAVASIATGDETRDAHLRSPDFFDAENDRDITFETTRMRHVAGGTYEVVGDLTIKGVTREVDLEATVDGSAVDPWGVERVGVSVRGSINRTDFGLTWQQRLAAGGLLVGEEITILVDVSAIRE